MAPQWSADDDRTLLLSLVQVMAPNGPSKHQFDAARTVLNDRWTLSAITQHYNKKLRLLAPATLGLEGGGSAPATPVRSATKRKAQTPKIADESASPTSGAESGRKKKKVSSKAMGEEAVVERNDEDDEEMPAKKVDESARDKTKATSKVASEKAVAERDVEDDDEQVATKKAKVDESEDQD